MRYAGALQILIPMLVGCGGAAMPPAEATLPAPGEALSPAARCFEEPPYQPRPAYSGPRPTLPSPGTMPVFPVKVGDAYTVRGVVHHLRSRVHGEEVNGKQLSLVGYIVKTNYESAPACALHRTGKGDPADCRSQLPQFSIADAKDEAHEMIDVMGWASNFAQVFTLAEEIDKAPRGKASEVRLKDEFWGIDLPNPLPNLGAKVKITGTYGVVFARTVSGSAANPRYGIMTADTIEYLEPPATKPSFKGLKTK
jgi:hypothetical protein